MLATRMRMSGKKGLPNYDSLYIAQGRRLTKVSKQHLGALWFKEYGGIVNAYRRQGCINMDLEGNVAVMNGTNGDAEVITPNNTIKFAIAGAGGLGHSYCFDKNGNLYIVSAYPFGGNTYIPIKGYTPAGVNFISANMLRSGSAWEVVLPSLIAIHNNEIYVNFIERSYDQGWQEYLHDIRIRVYSAITSNTLLRQSSVQQSYGGMVTNPYGDLHPEKSEIVNSGQGSWFRDVTRRALSLTAPSLSFIYGGALEVEYSPDGEFFYLLTQYELIKYNLAGTAQWTINLVSQFFPSGYHVASPSISVDLDGRIYLTCLVSNTMRLIQISPAGSTLRGPVSITIDPGNNAAVPQIVAKPSLSLLL